MPTKFSLIGATLILTGAACAHVESKETPSANGVSSVTKAAPTAGGPSDANSKELLPYQAPGVAVSPPQPADSSPSDAPASPDSPPAGPPAPEKLASTESKGEPTSGDLKSDGAAPARFVLTHGIQEREPVDEVTTFKPGERMYAFLEVGNGDGTEYSLKVRWSKDTGEPSQTPTSVTIGASPHWRTWSFRNAPQQRGSYLCRVETDQGLTLAEIPFQVESI